MKPKAGAEEKLKSVGSRLIDLSHRIHAHPELGFEEEQAANWICEFLDGQGFEIERGICDVCSSDLAKAGNGPMHVAICAEYDALPGIGHACGHNIIAASSCGAAIAAAAVAEDAGLTIHLIGTPAEEVGNASGKILLLQRGAFEGMHLAMMVHPAPFDAVMPKIIAASMFEVAYTGKASHASAFPELGINAADALTVAQTAIGLLRQHIRPSDRIHGIVTDGGDAPNIVPAHARAKYIIRAETIDDLVELRGKVHRCFDAGAIATGSTVKIIGGDQPYAEMIHDSRIAELYRKNAESLGRVFSDLGPLRDRAAASTDMGNVSLAVPSIHPMIGIESGTAVNHQPEFTAQCIRPSADKAILDAALAMAWTAIDAA